MIIQVSDQLRAGEISLCEFDQEEAGRTQTGWSAR
jgi:hypothetical protein